MNLFHQPLQMRHSLGSIRVLFEEYFDPVKSELDSIRDSLQIATLKFDEITDLSEKCSQLKAENLILKSKLQKTEINCQNVEERMISQETVSRRNNLKFVLMKRSNLKTWPNRDCELVMLSVGIGARSFNIDRSSHRTADIDTYYQHFNIETTYKKQTKIK